MRDSERIVMPTSKLFTPREAAQVLGVSYPALKQWIYKKKIRSVKTAGGHHRIPEKEVDRFLHRASEGGDVSGFARFPSAPAIGERVSHSERRQTSDFFPFPASSDCSLS